MTIDESTLRLLQDPALQMPKIRDVGTLEDFLGESNARFFALINRFKGRIGDILHDKNRRYWMRELASSIVATVEVTLQRRRERAVSLMEEILDEHLGALQLMSLRHSATVIGSRSWYRLTTWKGATTRSDVFHRPFQRPSPAYRYSKPGLPGIYLGNNVYVCWLECNSPLPLSGCKVARFEINAGDLLFLDLPANHSTYLQPLETAYALRRVSEVNLFRFQNSPYFQDVEPELAEYLSLWPLLMACSVQKSPNAAEDPPEYIVSQLVADWAIKQKRWLGVRYFTTKSDDAGNSQDLSINVVLPARTSNRTEGFCEFLTARVRCTLPQSFRYARRIKNRKLFTRAAADQRQEAAGRYMVHWRGAQRHYQDTPFGRMEYLLDRDEFPLKRIDES